MSCNIIYAKDFLTLQDAVNAALGGTPEDAVNVVRQAQKLLIINPGDYELGAPLKIYSASGLHIQAYGARIRAAVDMDALIDMTGSAYCTFSGAWLKTAPTVTVQKMLWLRNNHALAARSTTMNKIEDLVIEDRYVTGIWVGELGDATQCDSTVIQGVAMNGGWTKGNETLWQHGLRVGTGIFANCLLNAARDMVLSRHRYNLYVHATQIGADNINFAAAEWDVVAESTGYVSLRNSRSEESEGLWNSMGSARFPVNHTIEDVDVRGERTPAHGRVIHMQKGGTLRANQVRFMGVPAHINPTIAAYPPPGTSETPDTPFTIITEGLTMTGNPNAPVQSMFTTEPNRPVKIRATACTRVLASGITGNQVDYMVG
jgi:hypothetical protein